jgi:hypothetical protein
MTDNEFQKLKRQDGGFFRKTERPAVEPKLTLTRRIVGDWFSATKFYGRDTEKDSAEF